MHYSSDHVVFTELTEIKVKVIMDFLFNGSIANGFPFFRNQSRKGHVAFDIWLVYHRNPFPRIGRFEMAVNILLLISIYETM